MDIKDELERELAQSLLFYARRGMLNAGAVKEALLKAFDGIVAREAEALAEHITVERDANDPTLLHVTMPRPWFYNQG